MRSRSNPLYRLLNKEYHEGFDRYQAQLADFYEPVRAELPSAWTITRKDIWFYCSSPQNPVPRQGWKIHLSATCEDSAEVLRRVISVLFDRNDTNFKFALDRSILFLLNGKNWPRGGSGKFITIYPQNSHAFLQLIEELHQHTQGLCGPYILSDHCYKESQVVYYRYGGMQPYEVLNVRGERVPMLVAPDGSEVPDQRAPYPVTPSWAGALLPAHEFEKQSGGSLALRDGRFEIQTVLAFSNAGGVYLALDHSTGRRVVIKEARPRINVTSDGLDAIGLLKKEHRLLALLADTSIAPRPVDLFQEWAHWFLVEEYIEGIPLGSHSAANNILLRTRPAAEDYKQWYDCFRELCLELINIVDVLHSRNIVFADLSTSNLMVPAGTAKLKLIDFEGAYELGVDEPTTLYTPGFIPQSRLSGSAASFQDDYYAVGAVLFAYLFPLNGLFHLDPDAKYRLMESIRKDAHLPESVAAMILGLMSQDPAQRPALPESRAILQSALSPAEDLPHDEAQVDYAAVLQGIVIELNASADFERRDRLFPADPKLFATNPLSLAHGAAGVAYALGKVTGEFPTAIFQWILRHKLGAEKYPPGLYLGLSGIAWSLLEIGAIDQAEKVFRCAREHPVLKDSADLFYGMAGWGMTNLRFYMETHNLCYLDDAIQAGNNLLATCQMDSRGCCWPDASGEVPIGFAHGSSGIALFLLYLYLATGDPQFLDVGQKAMNFDLSFSASTRDGGLSWPKTAGIASPLYPYWRSGSAGIGLAVLRYYRLFKDPGYKTILDKIYIDADREYAVMPGRFNGLAGIGDFLLDMHSFTGESKYFNSAGKIARALMGFQIARKGIAFPGDWLSRLSCDYGTGSAGVALFLNRLVKAERNDFMLDELFDFARNSSIPAAVCAESYTLCA